MVTFDCHGNANGHLSWAVLCVNLLFTDTRMHTHARTHTHTHAHSDLYSLEYIHTHTHTLSPSTHTRYTCAVVYIQMAGGHGSGEAGSGGERLMEERASTLTSVCDSQKPPPS